MNRPTKTQLFTFWWSAVLFQTEGRPGKNVTGVWLGRKKSRPGGTNFGIRKLNGTGGKPKQGQQPLDVIEAEEPEETGIITPEEQIYLAGVILNDYRFAGLPARGVVRFDHVFVHLAEKPLDQEHLETEEMEKFELYPLSRLPELAAAGELLPDTIRWLPKLLKQWKPGQYWEITIYYGPNEVITSSEIEVTNRP